MISEIISEAEIEAAARALHSSTPNGNTGLLTRHGVRMALLAARRDASAPSFADVRIKPLEWVERSQDRGDGTSEPNGDWEALATTGRYYIELLGDRWSLQRDDYTDLGVFDSPDEAKAAGQTDYERRILSALAIIPTSSGVGEDEVDEALARQKALSEAVQAYEDVIGKLASPLSEKAVGAACAAYAAALAHNPQASSGGEGNGAEAAAPKPDPAIAELVEVIRDEATDGDGLHNLLLAAENVEAALTASNDRVAELERERDEALATMTRATEAMVECGNLLADEDLKREAAEAEVSRLKAGAVTDWQLIESVPKDGRSIAVWLPATATEQPHAFAPVSICEDGTWWDDSTGDQIEPLAATYWAPIHAPSALSNQAKASK